MSEQILKQIEENTRKAKNYLGFFVILVSSSIVGSIIYIVAESTK